MTTDGDGTRWIADLLDDCLSYCSTNVTRWETVAERVGVWVTRPLPETDEVRVAAPAQVRPPIDYR